MSILGLYCQPEAYTHCTKIGPDEYLQPILFVKVLSCIKMPPHCELLALPGMFYLIVRVLESTKAVFLVKVLPWITSGPDF